MGRHQAFLLSTGRSGKKPPRAQMPVPCRVGDTQGGQQRHVADRRLTSEGLARLAAVLHRLSGWQ